MTSALDTTLKVLTSSRNESTVPVLIAALDSCDEQIFDGALKTLVARRNKAGHSAVISRWHQLSASQRELLSEGRGRMSGALRDAVLSGNLQLFQNACELVEEFTEFDLVPTLITLAENPTSEHAQAATDLVIRLVNHLSEMLYGTRDSNERRNPESLRKYLLESLERSVERFRRHKRTELIEAFVVLAGPHCGMLSTILDDIHHACYTTVVHTMAKSESKGILALLLGFLQTEGTASGVLNVISRRKDEAFVGQLLGSVSDEGLAKMAKNLKRIKSFAWLTKEEPGIDRFEEENQVACVKLIAATNLQQNEVLRVLEQALIYGGPSARLAACEALLPISGDRPSQLILQASSDSDPQVQAAATRQLRDRHLPGAMSILLKLIDSPHEIVREASRESLGEFSFENFVTQYETLSEDARRSTSMVVRKVDPGAAVGLLVEMEHKSRKHRLRAIEMAETLHLVPQVGEGLIGLLADEDHVVRAATADALQLCQTPEVFEALQHATTDSSTAVQNAAKNSLTFFSNMTGAAATGVMSPTEG